MYGNDLNAIRPSVLLAQVHTFGLWVLRITEYLVNIAEGQLLGPAIVSTEAFR